jgi:transcriptional regulator with XRE-family HTH domain
MSGMADIYEPDWLDRAMREAKVRTGELAAASGVSRSQIQRIRNGMSPRLDTLRALQTALASKSIAA